MGDYENNGGELDQELLRQALRIIWEITRIMVEIWIKDC